MHVHVHIKGQLCGVSYLFLPFHEIKFGSSGIIWQQIPFSVSYLTSPNVNECYQVGTQPLILTTAEVTSALCQLLSMFWRTADINPTGPESLRCC